MLDILKGDLSLNGIEISELVVIILIVIGTIFSFLSGIGLIRFPDVYSRAHAASKSASLGVLATLFGTFLYFLLKDEYISIRLILGILFVFLTSPVVAHLVNRSAYRSNVPLAKESVQDDLKDFFNKNDDTSSTH